MTALDSSLSLNALDHAASPSPQNNVAFESLARISSINTSGPVIRSSRNLENGAPGEMSAEAASPRPASMRAQTGRPASRKGYASRSRLPTPTMGSLAEIARPLATLNPVRRALNPPGPSATATADNDPGPPPTPCKISATAGISSVEWLTVDLQDRVATTLEPSWRATEAFLVDVSIESSILCQIPRD